MRPKARRESSSLLVLRGCLVQLGCCFGVRHGAVPPGPPVFREARILNEARVVAAGVARLHCAGSMEKDGAPGVFMHAQALWGKGAGGVRRGRR
eukprot:245666-Lingulodinium_polyedra.AAC.1